MKKLRTKKTPSYVERRNRGKRATKRLKDKNVTYN